MKNQEIEFAVWDLETTGFVAPECKIIEIGLMVKYKDSDELMARSWVLNNECEIPEKITEITGFTKEMIDKDGRDPKECINEFLPYILQAPKNITHNGIKFDIPFLVAYVADLLGYSEDEKTALSELLRSAAYDTAVHFKAQKLGMIPDTGEHFDLFADRVMNVRAYGVKFNLGLCCEENNVDMSKITLHRALGDVAMTYELYKLISAPQPEEELPF